MLSTGVRRLNFAYERHATYSNTSPAAYTAQNAAPLNTGNPHRPNNTAPANWYSTECVMKKNKALLPNTISGPLSTLTALDDTSSNGARTIRHAPRFQRRYTSDGGYLTMLKKLMRDSVAGGETRDGFMFPNPPKRRMGINIEIMATPSTCFLDMKEAKIYKNN
jgi:hypothetical protein